MEDFINDKETRERVIEGLSMDNDYIILNFNQLEKIIS